MTRKVLLSLVLLLVSASLVWGMRFDHRAHLEDYFPGISCDACHLPDAPSIIPDKAVCLDCHDPEYGEMTTLGAIKTHGPVWALNHRSEAKSGAMDCAACHQQSFCLDCHKAGFADEQGDFGNAMINVHSSDFHITHPIAARTNQQLCASCHESSFCMDCHADFRGRTGRASGPSHARTFAFRDGSNFHAGAPAGNCDQCHTTDTVAPSFHEWSLGHAREARRSLATCQSCHPGGDVCLNCHGMGGINPHGKGWRDRAGRLKNASNAKTCNQCHL
ncbi:cytochrome C [Geoalkalibacter halelectricus]|uniref:Cytochrome C n=1 Tax=Geoalkalibacter halelectricus TaxID=2847045 RepID=A0ABY5ZNT7_9BACT|nr:cytochrome c3 family protein [Geoalkalibacter halelectricus]UWZ80174.1 cytochrome C [Geoalkalibacter halelectricus]